MAIRGFIFDFDGLIIDTETPQFIAWDEAYNQFGVRFPSELLMAVIGTSDGDFNPLQYLQASVQQPLNLEKILQKKRRRTLELVNQMPILPGVMEYIAYAQNNHMRIGLASSSDRPWIEYHLRRRNLSDVFECVYTADEVSRTKPDPELFNLTIRAMNLRPEECLVLDDSPLGVRAAKEAGANCIAVATEYTRTMDLNAADIVIHSLAELNPYDAIKSLNQRSNHK